MDRILELSLKHRLSHLGSCITMYPILEEIYNQKKPDDLVILSAGHAGVAQYVIIEKTSEGKINAEELISDMGVHPSRDINRGIHVSSGSLGSAILVCVGLAIANKSRDIHCLLTDGECAEGSVWEALSFCKKNNLINMKVYVNINGFSAYDTVDRDCLETRLRAFCPWIKIYQTQNPEFLGGLNAHYHVLKTEEERNSILTGLL